MQIIYNLCCPSTHIYIYSFEQSKKDMTNLDLAFLIDCTGSMGPHLNNTRNCVEKIVEASIKKYDNNVRVGFVAYRDIKSNLRFVQEPFSSDIQKVISVMKNLTTTNVGQNGDIPEDVHGGMQVGFAICFLKKFIDIIY